MPTAGFPGRLPRPVAPPVAGGPAITMLALASTNTITQNNALEILKRLILIPSL
jgi:hypothetical protein